MTTALTGGPRPPAPPIIDYASSPAAMARSSVLRWLLLVGALPALIAPFVEFVWGVSPLEALRGFWEKSFFDVLPLALLGTGFFAAFPAVAWRAHVLLRPEPGRRARRSYLALAALFWAALIWLLAIWSRAMFEQVRTSDWTLLVEGYPFAIAGLIAIVGVLLAWRLFARGHANRAMGAVLTTPYLASVLLCLMGFPSWDPALGYVLTLIVAVLWAIELAVDAVRVLTGAGATSRADPAMCFDTLSG